MFEVIDKFTKYFTWDKINIDNWNWKLYSKASVGLCMLAAATCVCTSYFGNAIDCLDTEDKFITQYCWVHGSYQFESDQKNLVEKIQKRTRQNCLQDDFYDKKDKTPTTAYYQWVVFMLFGHGCLFMLANGIWKFAEGGLIDDFVAEEDLERKAKKFNNLSKSQNRVYFTTFVACEILNLGVAIFNFYMMDIFLNGQFLFYGTDVVKYLMNNNIEDEYNDYGSSSDLGMVNPMCAAFPTLVNCEYVFAGANGEPDVRSRICILSQNIVNEKIYLLLWFWLALLFGVSGLMLLYRSSTIFIPHFRQYELLYRARKGTSGTIHELQKYISLSEWFILCQIGRNSKSQDFNEFLRNLKPLVKKSWERANNKNEPLLPNKNEPLLSSINQYNPI